jgi:hypothetical protein
LNTPQARDAGRDGREQTVSFGGCSLGTKRHICAFFDSSEEEYGVLMPFIKEGLDCGDKAFHVVAPGRREEHLKRLFEAGIDIDASRGNGQLELCDWNEMYLPDGRFDQHRMIRTWNAALDGAIAQGYPRTRLVAHMEWCLLQREGVDDLLEYEARLNLDQRDRDPIICTYDVSKYSGAFVIDVMRTHPAILVGGIVQDNPFYVPPETFIRDLRNRDTRIRIPMT